MRRGEFRKFLNAMKFLIFAGIFLTTGVFLVLTYMMTDIDQNFTRGTIKLKRGEPELIEIENIQEGDTIYVTIEAGNYVDVMVDTLENCYLYVADHDAYDPYDFPPSSYKLRKVIDGSFSFKANNSELGIVFQKTDYSGIDDTELKYELSYPNHISQMFCMPMGIIFMAGGLSLIVIHFVMKRREQRFEPIDNAIEKEIKSSKPVEDDPEWMDEEPKKRKGKRKGKGSKKSGASKRMHHSSDSVESKKGKKKGKK